MNKSREGSIFLHFSLCATAFVFIRVQWLRRSNRRKEKETLLQARNEILSPSLSISYSLEPLVILKGRGTYLYDDTGRQYLDCVNNVATCGHGHPRITQAASSQLSAINTNTRYLHPKRISYAKKLLSTFPPHLNCVVFCCSGSEANDLALRLAHAYTRAKKVLVLDRAYHGATISTVGLSPYKFNGRGGHGAPDDVVVVPCPDSYRGRFRARANSSEVNDYIAVLEEEVRRLGSSLAAIYAEPILGCAGQIVPPASFLRRAFEVVRAHGGVCIADEVQVGFGRTGEFWGFQAFDAEPDMVTLGKGIGNGYPMAAVVGRKEIFDAFAAEGMEYFNTCGGSNAACAVGEAVLDIIFDEGLQHNAKQVGNTLITLLNGLKQEHPGIIGDVRGMGLFIGVELMLLESGGGESQAATREAAAVVMEMKQTSGVLVSVDGPDENVIKIKPPLCFSEKDAHRLVDALNGALRTVLSIRRRCN